MRLPRPLNHKEFYNGIPTTIIIGEIISLGATTGSLNDTKGKILWPSQTCKIRFCNSRFELVISWAHCSQFLGAMHIWALITKRVLLFIFFFFLLKFVVLRPLGLQFEGEFWRWIKLWLASKEEEENWKERKRRRS